MIWFKDTLQVITQGKGLYPFTILVNNRIRDWKIEEGMCFLYIPHTSASLLISESYDPTARVDLETFAEKLVPDDADWYEHILEGKDDSSSHIRSMLTQTSLSIPIDEGQLSLGTWQGIFLFEHRILKNKRNVLLRCLNIKDT